jgi:hypothetical protein
VTAGAKPRVGPATEKAATTMTAASGPEREMMSLPIRSSPRVRKPGPLGKPAAPPSSEALNAAPDTDQEVKTAKPARDKAAARRAANVAMGTIDGMLAALHTARATLVAEVRAYDDATAARVDAMLASRA